VRGGGHQPAGPALEGGTFLAQALGVAAGVVYAWEPRALDSQAPAILRVEELRVVVDVEAVGCVDAERGREAVFLAFGASKCQAGLQLFLLVGAWLGEGVSRA
jgi:hypothetical protein